MKKATAKSRKSESGKRQAKTLTLKDLKKLTGGTILQQPNCGQKLYGGMKCCEDGKWQEP